MNGLILSFFTALLWVFHMFLHTCTRRGKVKESFCAGWCMDAVFAVCGTMVSFFLFDYSFLPYLTLRNIVLAVLYLSATALFFLLTPSGFSLFAQKSTPSKEELLLCEYHFNDTISLVRNYILALLFVLPILLTVAEMIPAFPALWGNFSIEDIYGGFCFASFLILVPMSLRQMIFWFKSLRTPVCEAEEKVLQTYRTTLCLHSKNFFL